MARAIAWSLEEGTTTRKDRAGPPGGLGLFLLREFVKVNDGKVRIIANRGYYVQTGGGEWRETLTAEFPGTLFQFTFQVRDDVLYYLDV